METSGRSVNELARACACSSDSREWEEFLRRSLPLVTLVAARVCRMWTGSYSSAMVDDIAQEVLLKLCEQERRILREFEARGEDSFFALLRTVSASVANDYLRRLYSAKRGGKVVTFSLDEEPQQQAITPVSNPTGKLQQTVLHTQLDAMLQSAPDAISARDRTIFWLYYLQGFTAEEISTMAGTGLSAKGVESALRRIGNWLREEMGRRRSGGLVKTL